MSITNFSNLCKLKCYFNETYMKKVGFLLKHSLKAFVTVFQLFSEPLLSNITTFEIKLRLRSKPTSVDNNSAQSINLYDIDEQNQLFKLV